MHAGIVSALHRATRSHGLAGDCCRSVGAVPGVRLAGDTLHAPPQPPPSVPLFRSRGSRGPARSDKRAFCAGDHPVNRLRPGYRGAHTEEGNSESCRSFIAQTGLVPPLCLALAVDVDLRRGLIVTDIWAFPVRTVSVKQATPEAVATARKRGFRIGRGRLTQNA